MSSIATTMPATPSSPSIAPAYRVAAANDGWERIEAFFAAHLGG